MNRKHIDTERVFQLGFFVEKVGKIGYIRALFQFNDNPDSLFGGLIGNIYDIVCDLIFLKGCHIRQELGNPASDHGIGDFAYN